MTNHEMSWHIMIDDVVLSWKIVKCHQKSPNITICAPNQMSSNVTMLNHQRSPKIFQINMVTFGDMSCQENTGFSWHNQILVYISGTNEERGIVDSSSLQQTELPSCFDLPFGMDSVRKQTWTKYIPFSPTYQGGVHCHRKQAEENAVAHWYPGCMGFKMYSD